MSDPNNQDVTVTLEASNGKLTVQTDVSDGLTSNNLANNNTKKVTIEGSIGQINKTFAASTGIIYRLWLVRYATANAPYGMIVFFFYLLLKRK